MLQSVCLWSQSRQPQEASCCLQACATKHEQQLAESCASAVSRLLSVFDWGHKRTGSAAHLLSLPACDRGQTCSRSQLQLCPLVRKDIHRQAWLRVCEVSCLEVYSDRQKHFKSAGCFLDKLRELLRQQLTQLSLLPCQSGLACLRDMMEHAACSAHPPEASGAVHIEMLCRALQVTSFCTVPLSPRAAGAACSMPASICS